MSVCCRCAWSELIYLLFSNFNYVLHKGVTFRSNSVHLIWRKGHSIPNSPMRIKGNTIRMLEERKYHKLYFHLVLLHCVYLACVKWSWHRTFVCNSSFAISINCKTYSSWPMVSSIQEKHIRTWLIDMKLIRDWTYMYITNCKQTQTS